MRDALIIAFVCVAAIALGVWLYAGQGEKSNRAGGTEIEVLIQGQNAGAVTERKNFRLKNKEQLEQLWRSMYTSDGPALPAVDFSTHEVLAVFDGSHSSGGYGVEVVSVQDSNTARQVVIRRIVPDENCITTDAITNPFILVVLPKSNLPIVRTEETKTVLCR